MKIRSLTIEDKAAIVSVLDSRAGLAQNGVSWTIDSILEEVKTSASLGYFQTELQSFILFKDMGDVLEILLIYSRKGAFGAAEAVLSALIANHKQSQEIWLEVHEDNAAAIRFYESYGFIKNGYRRFYYPDGRGAFNYTQILKR